MKVDRETCVGVARKQPENQRDDEEFAALARDR